MPADGLQHLHGEMQRIADAGRAVVEAARLGLGERDQFGDRVRGKLGVGRDHELRGHHLRDRHEILVHVERQRAVERRADRQAVGGEEDGVAVGRRLGERIGREIAARAGAILHHHRLAELLGELVAEEPGQGVDGAAGRERHDDADGPVRIALRQRAAGRKRQRQTARSQAQRGAGSWHPPWTRGLCLADAGSPRLAGPEYRCDSRSQPGRRRRLAIPFECRFSRVGSGSRAPDGPVLRRVHPEQLTSAEERGRGSRFRSLHSICPSYALSSIRPRGCREHFQAAIRRIAPQPTALPRNIDAIVQSVLFTSA